MTHRKHIIRNATANIVGVLRPYRAKKVIDDQDWAYVLVCLRQIENTCKDALPIPWYFKLYYHFKPFKAARRIFWWRDK